MLRVYCPTYRGPEKKDFLLKMNEDEKCNNYLANEKVHRRFFWNNLFQLHQLLERVLGASCPVQDARPLKLAESVFRSESDGSVERVQRPLDIVGGLLHHGHVTHQDRGQLVDGQSLVVIDDCFLALVLVI